MNGPKRVGSGKNQRLPKSTYATVDEDNIKFDFEQELTGLLDLYVNMQQSCSLFYDILCTYCIHKNEKKKLCVCLSMYTPQALRPPASVYCLQAASILSKGGSLVVYHRLKWQLLVTLSPSGFLSVNSHFSGSNMIQSQDVFLASRDEAHYSSFPDLNGRVSLSLSIYLSYLSIYLSVFLSFVLSACIAIGHNYLFGLLRLHRFFSPISWWDNSPSLMVDTEKKIRQLSAWLMRTSRKSERSQLLLSIIEFH